MLIIMVTRSAQWTSPLSPAPSPRKSHPFPQEVPPLPPGDPQSIGLAKPYLISSLCSALLVQRGLIWGQSGLIWGTFCAPHSLDHSGPTDEQREKQTHKKGGQEREELPDQGVNLLKGDWKWEGNQDMFWKFPSLPQWKSSVPPYIQERSVPRFWRPPEGSMWLRVRQGHQMCCR